MTANVRKTFSTILGAVATIVISISVYLNSNEVISHLKSINYLALILASTAYFILTWLTARYFSKLLPPQRESTYIFLASQLTKYIPGKIWQFGHQLALSPGNIKLKNIINANIHLTLIQLLTCLSIFSITALFILSKTDIFIQILIIATIALTTFIIIALLSKRKSKSLWSSLRANSMPNKTAFIAQFTVLYLVSYSLAAIAFIDTKLLSSVILAINSAGAWAIGTASIIFPAGLGIREASFVGIIKALQIPISYSEALSFAILTRFWQLILDLITGTTGMTKLWLIKKKSAM